MKDSPSITIFVGTPLRADSSLLSIQSILEQSFEDFEVIIMREHLTNDLTEIGSRIFDDPRVKIMELPSPIRPTRTPSIPLSYAKGKYVCITHSNTVSSAKRVEMQFDFMEHETDVGAVGSSSEIFNEDRILANVWCPQTSKSIKTALLRRNCYDQSSLMFRSSCLRALNLSYQSDWKYCADFELALKFSWFHSMEIVPTEILRYQVYKKDLPFEELQLQLGYLNKVRCDALRTFGITADTAEIDLHLKLMENEYLNDQELDRAVDWFSRLLRQNHKSKLYDQDCLGELFDNVLRVAKEKNELGNWSIDKSVLAFIKNKLEVGKTILEFGSGMGTDALLRSYRVISIEHNLNYAYRHAHNHTCIYSPLENNWYRRADIQEALREPSDLLIVDGPSGNRRTGLLKNLDLFANYSKPVIFDDVDRAQDNEIMISFCRELHYGFEIRNCGSKQFGYCEKEV